MQFRKDWIEHCWFTGPLKQVPWLSTVSMHPSIAGVAVSSSQFGFVSTRPDGCSYLGVERDTACCCRAKPIFRHPRGAAGVRQVPQARRAFVRFAPWFVPPCTGGKDRRPRAMQRLPPQTPGWPPAGQSPLRASLPSCCYTCRTGAVGIRSHGITDSAGDAALFACNILIDAEVATTDRPAEDNPLVS
jgi:hypothetical protein